VLDPYSEEGRPKVGSLVRLCYGCGEGYDSDAEPRYNPGVVVEVRGYAVTIVWPSVLDPETWATNVLEVLSG